VADKSGATSPFKSNRAVTGTSTSNSRTQGKQNILAVSAVNGNSCEIYDLRVYVSTVLDPNGGPITGTLDQNGMGSKSHPSCLNHSINTLTIP
jgi:hypothetical protein